MARIRMSTVTAVWMLWVAATAAAQTCGWRWANPNPPRVHVRAASSASGRIVAVGDRGLAMHTGDGVRWTLSDSGVASDLVGLARGAGQFVAVGGDRIGASPDGVAWVVIEVAGIDLVDVAYGASWFVAVADAGLDGQVLRSSDGIGWEAVAAPWSGSARAVGADGDGIVALVGDDLWRTEDTVTWTAAGTLPDASTTYVGENPLARDDVLVAGTTVLASRGAELYRMVGAEEPVLVTTLAPGCEQFSSFVGLWRDGNRMVASGFEACPPLLDPAAYVLVSSDGGATWELSFTDSGGGFPAMTRSGSVTVALGARGDLLVGSTVEQWECVGSGCTSGACEDALLDVVATAGGLVAVGGVGQCNRIPKRLAGGTRAVSDAGLRWSVDAVAGTARLHDLAVDDDLLVAVGDSWIGHSSDDGETWTEADAGALPALHSVAWAGDRFAAVGVGGLLLTSDDGSTWANVFTPTDADLYAVESFDDLSWIVGRDGTALSSPDLLFWDPVALPVARALHGIARPPWGWVIVGDGGALVTSSDGTSWTAPFTGLGDGVDLRDAVADGELVVAVGGGATEDPSEIERGVVIASRDGASWTRWTVPGGRLETVIRAGDGLVAVGADRSLLWAPCVADLIVLPSPVVDVGLGPGGVLEVGLGRPAPSALRLELSATPAGVVTLPSAVVLAAGQSSVSVPVEGDRPGASAVVTVSLPDEVGAGAADVLIRVESDSAVRRVRRRAGP